MMIGLDRSRCTRCGTCIRMMEGYCISSDGGYPVFDERVCNTCQKCVAICPSQAITVNGRHARRISGETGVDMENLASFFERRRSTKRFSDRPLRDDILWNILRAGRYAPNQNKNISVAAITDRNEIERIDREVLRFVKRMHRLLFGSPIVTGFIRVFYPGIDIIRKKMEAKGLEHGIDENIQAVVLLTGDRRVAVTERSSHYIAASMMYMAEASGVGSCLMDSIYHTVRTSRKLRQQLGISDDVLAAIVFGYSDENVVNIPQGFELDIRYI